jgi:hypothetical protein
LESAEPYQLDAEGHLPLERRVALWRELDHPILVRPAIRWESVMDQLSPLILFPEPIEGRIRAGHARRVILDLLVVAPIAPILARHGRKEGGRWAQDAAHAALWALSDPSVRRDVERQGRRIAAFSETLGETQDREELAASYAGFAFAHLLFAATRDKPLALDRGIDDRDLDPDEWDTSVFALYATEFSARDADPAELRREFWTKYLRAAGRARKAVVEAGKLPAPTATGD